MKTAAERVATYRRKMREQQRCITCGTKVRKGTRCPKHAKMHREGNRRWLEKMRASR